MLDQVGDEISHQMEKITDSLNGICPLNGTDELVGDVDAFIDDYYNIVLYGALVPVLVAFAVVTFYLIGVALDWKW